MTIEGTVHHDTTFGVIRPNVHVTTASLGHLHCTVRPVVGLEALTSRSPRQLYYWTVEWQESEGRAKADIAAGRTNVLRTPDDVEQYFNSLAEDKKE